MTLNRQHRYSVYILGSIKGTLYIGVTNDLVVRVRQHQQHVFGGFTAKYDVNRLLYYEVYADIAYAIRREKQLKGWRREKKIALIEKQNPQWRDLSRDCEDLRLRRCAVETFDQQSGSFDSASVRSAKQRIGRTLRSG